MVNIVLLGTGGAVPTPDRAPSASWITLDDRSLLLDPGPGASARLLASPYGPDSLDQLDTVLFTHLHPDHCADLLPLLFALKLKNLALDAPLHLIGPRGIKSYLNGLQELYGDWARPLRRRVQVLELAPEQGLVPSSDPETGWSVTSGNQGASVLAFRAAHFESRFSAWNLGYRFRDRSGHTLVHSGDSGPCAELASAAKGSDLLVAECSLSVGEVLDGHLAPEDVGALAKETNPDRVVLTHLPPGASGEDAVTAVRRIWDGDVVAARDGDRFSAPANPS